MNFRTLEVRSNRLKFVRFLHSEYGLSIQTAYAKIRQWRVKEWETMGIKACVREYDPKYRRLLSLFYESIKGSKLLFLDFMLQKGMCTKTASERFRTFNFTRLELEGLTEAHRKFIALHPEVEKETSEISLTQSQSTTTGSN